MAGIRDKFHWLTKAPDDEYEEYYDDEPQEEGGRDNDRRVSFSRIEPRENKVVNFNQKTQMQMAVYRPMSFGEETRSIADELLRRNTVVLILEKADKEVARRTVDFLSGVAYANNGKVKLVASNIVILAPYNMDLTGDDLLDELESSGIYF